MNKKPKAVSVSIIIPVYNEENYLKSCLESIKIQIAKPDEVIVVDNNCTDDSIKVAKSYPFVKVVSEEKQGMIYAIAKGFNSSSGDILCRIDADTIINNTWVKTVLSDFSDSEIMGLTGPAYASPVSSKLFNHSRMWSLSYFWSTEIYFGIRIMWGSNMAIRRSVWQKIGQQTNQDESVVHEDQDLSFLMAGQDLKIMRDMGLNAVISGKNFYDYKKIKEYFARRKKTRDYHAARKTIHVSKVTLPLGHKIKNMLLLILTAPYFILWCLPYGCIDVLLAKVHSSGGEL